MVNFLEKIINVLSDTQKQAIKALVSEKTITGDLISLRSQQIESEKIYNRIKGSLGTILTNPKYAVPGERISSDDYNEDMESIFLDLTALYINIDLLANTVDKQGITLNSEYFKSRAAIEKILNDVAVFSLRKQYPEFNEIKLIDFNSTVNKATRGAVAEVDPNVRLLKLKPAISIQKQLIDRNKKHTKIYSKTYGKGLKDDLGILFPIENIVDQKPETFWGNVVLADAPIRQIYEKPTTSGINYQIEVLGPVTEIYFRFSHIEKINNIKISPFSEFPIKIIDIGYRSSLSNQIFTQIEDFTPVVTSDWEEYNFTTVHAAEVRITIAQENYKNLSYVLPKSIIHNTDIFQHILKQRISTLVESEIANSDYTLYALGNLSKYKETIDLLQKEYSSANTDITTQPNIIYSEDMTKVLEKIYSTLSPEDFKEKIKELTSSDILQQPDKVDVTTISKYEYFLGIRDIAIGHIVYYPTCVYESDKYALNSTISEIQVQVEDRHPEFDTEWQKDYRKTSVEWEIELSPSKKLPVHPINLINKDNGYPEAKDELIYFDYNTRKAFSRLGSRFSYPHRLKKNGTVIPESLYNSIRTSGNIPYLEITLDSTWIDTSSIYTIDYYVAPTSYNISILDNFYSQSLNFPEIFTGVGSDNEIILEQNPYVNFEIINTDLFEKQANRAVWELKVEDYNISSGQLLISPTIYDNVGNLLQLGNVTGQILSGSWGERSGSAPADLSSEIESAFFGTINGIEGGYFLQAMDSNSFAEIDTIYSGNIFVLKEPLEVTIDQCRSWDAISSGNVFIGDLSIPSGQLFVDYNIGAGFKSDNQIFALSNNTYSPITVYVSDVLADNVTNYVTKEQPSFTVTENSSSLYQYIHKANRIYFNKKITNKQIKIYYNWINEYIKINGKLNCHEPINPSLTPKVNSIKLFINNIVL